MGCRIEGVILLEMLKHDSQVINILVMIVTAILARPVPQSIAAAGVTMLILVIVHSLTKAGCVPLTCLCTEYVFI
jgi:isopentenyl phosphate kinase